MAEPPRLIDVAIVGLGSCVTIQLSHPIRFGVFKESVVTKFGLTPRMMTRLELRRVGTQPSRLSSSRLFDEGVERPIELDVDLQAVDVQFIVGMIAETPGTCLHRQRPSLCFIDRGRPPSSLCKRATPTQPTPCTV